MAYLAIIVGISGNERFLGQDREVEAAKRAKKFRSDEAAQVAALAHIRQFEPVIQRHVSYRVQESA